MTPLPLDHPYPSRPHRIYVALTNHCNRSCPWCSTCSSPAGKTWITAGQFRETMPEHVPFEMQLEGGEPTVHPDFLSFAKRARAHPMCRNLVVCTNGTRMPRSRDALRAWILELGEPLTVKLAINHHLMEHDPGLLELARLAVGVFGDLGGARMIVLNVRLRRGYDDDDRRVRAAVEIAGLSPHANVFYLQRYGFASEISGWDPPAPVWNAFSLVNPDGATYGQDLIARSEAMRRLP